MSSGTGNNIRNRSRINGSGVPTASGSGVTAATGTTDGRGSGAIARRPVTAIVLPSKKPLATITNHQQPPARKMDYNNYCHQSGASPNSKSSSTSSKEAVAINEAKGVKLKALHNGTVPDLSNGHSNGRLVRPEQLLLGQEGIMLMATNGHSNISHRQQQQQHNHNHHHQQQDDNREAVENVMPSNKSQQQRYFSNEKAVTVTYQNNTNQQTAGILKPKDQSSNALEKDHKSTQAGNHLVARGNGVTMSMKDGGGGATGGSDNINHMSSNGAVRRVRNRNESTDVYLVNSCGQEDNNLKRSREDCCKTIVNGTRTASNGIERERERLNQQQQQRSTANNSINKGNLKELYIEDVKSANGDCDKELVSPPAKVSSKTVVVVGDLQPINSNGNKLEDAELAESEYSSLDDEEADEDDDFDEDVDGAAGGNDQLLEEDVYDAMTAEDSTPNGTESSLLSSNDNSGKATTRELPGSVSGCVRGGTSSSASVPFSASLFPNVPLYFSFSTHTEAGPTLPACITKVMKWKVTPVTPVVVRKVLVNTGFRLLKQTNDWMGVWGKHMKSPQFRTIRSYQKFNHIPGSFQIGRKDRLWRNLEGQIRRNGKKEFGFMPRTYILPQDLKCLRQMWPKYSQQNVKWIIKPPASARGVGIKVVNRWSQIPKRKPIIVQRYVERPLLIQGNKFDLRLYVLVTSINPLRVYLHTDGLARFASVRYSENAATLNDRYMHLTNYSINKLSANYAKNEDADSCQGHKWTLRSLWQYLEGTCGVDTERLWGTLRNLIIRTLLAGESPINNMTRANLLSKYNCFELFGFDVLLDSDLSPWLLEVNISPSLHSASPLDLRVKGSLVQAVLNTAMYQVPPKLAEDKQQEVLQQMGLPPSQRLCHDKRIYTMALTREERVKHSRFVNKELRREEYLDAILEDLTPDDVRCLILTEDELARCSPLERIFPAPNTHAYLDFTDNPRYYNRLLDAWETKYSKKRPDAIALLRDLCEKKVHLDVPPFQPSAKKASNNKSTIPNTIPSASSSSNSNSSSSRGASGEGRAAAGQRGPESYRESSVESISTTTSTLSDCTSSTTPSILPLSTSSSGTDAIRGTDLSSSFSSITSQLLLLESDAASAEVKEKGLLGINRTSGRNVL